MLLSGVGLQWALIGVSQVPQVFPISGTREILPLKK